MDDSKIKITIEAEAVALRALLGGFLDNASDLLGLPSESITVTTEVPVESVPEAIKVITEDESIARGFEAFRSLVDVWRDGFDTSGMAHWDEEAEDPNRPDLGEMLFKLSTSRLNGNVLGYIEGCAGLTRAVFGCLLDLNRGQSIDANETRTLARSMAINIAQVGSIRFPEVCPLLEQHDPLIEEPQPDEVLHGVQ